MQLRDDQKRCIEDLPGKPYLEACAGSGKSLLASLILSDVQEASAGTRRKCFFLTPNRDQRQSAVRGLRQGMADPFQVVGVGRPTDANPTTDDNNSFDADAEKRMEQLTEESRRRIEILEVEVDRAFGGDGCPEAPQDVKRRALEALSHARFELTKQREAILLETFEKASILCMTLDGFLQFIAGSSALSHLMEGYSVALSMIDECQLIPAEHLAAVACNSNEILCIFDRQQAMPIAAEMPRDASHARSEGSFLFSSDANVYDWQHAAGLEENQILRLWELVPADATQGAEHHSAVRCEDVQPLPEDHSRVLRCTRSTVQVRMRHLLCMRSARLRRNRHRSRSWRHDTSDVICAELVSRRRQRWAFASNCSADSTEFSKSRRHGRSRRTMPRRFVQLTARRSDFRSGSAVRHRIRRRRSHLDTYLAQQSAAAL